jgi:hypothetical protein
MVPIPASGKPVDIPMRLWSLTGLLSTKTSLLIETDREAPELIQMGVAFELKEIG